MLLPGENRLVLTREAVCRMIEDALNAPMQDGEDYIRVTDVDYSSYRQCFEFCITTDTKEANCVES